jgi:hypothetical protein
MTGHELALFEMFDLDTSTWVVFVLFGLMALKAISNHASIISMFVAFPVVVFMSVCVNHFFRVMEWFNPEKMAEWLAFTIMAGTFGTLLGVGIVIAIDRLVDRVPASAGSNLPSGS